MKKYIQPQIEIISLYMEEGLMLSMSGNSDEKVTEDGNWSNKKEGPFGQGSSIWDNME